MWPKLKAFVSRLWGAATTQLLAFLVMIQPALDMAHPQLLIDYPWLRGVIFAVGIAVMVLRFAAPPKAT